MNHQISARKLFYGKSFKATIESIDEENKFITVEGLNTNKENNKDKYCFVVEYTTEIIWRNEKIDVSDLSVGNTILITATGRVFEESPAFLEHVLFIELLEK